MALKTRFLRDRQNRVCGTVTGGYLDGSETVRNRRGELIGRVLHSQKMTKDAVQRTNLIADCVADWCRAVAAIAAVCPAPLPSTGKCLFAERD